MTETIEITVLADQPVTTEGSWSNGQPYLASEEIERSFELRTRDRERKLTNKIDSALKRIEDGSYGYCDETGEPISIKRLEARPVATLSLEAQEMHEKAEKKLN